MKSAIQDIINGERGKLDHIKMSEKYFADLGAANELEKTLTEKLKDYPDFLELYRKVSEAEAALKVTEVDEVYKEAFRFAFLIAIDVFCGE